MATVKVTEQKVILCGEYGVGKTSIFRRFANNTFVASNDRKSTLGLDNIDKEYVVEDRRIRVSVNVAGVYNMRMHVGQVAPFHAKREMITRSLWKILP